MYDRSENLKKHLTLSNGIYAFSILFALGVLLKVYLDRYRLPEGVCPTAYNNQWIYLSIGLLILATIVTSIMDRRNKKLEASEAKEKDSEE